MKLFGIAAIWRVGGHHGLGLRWSRYRVLTAIIAVNEQRLQETSSLCAGDLEDEALRTWL